ncbi:hypothetical protein BDA96_03G299100 [Sorghum bicolor]|uniref:Uncharacterized protein n=2 Tax=Sorghum bicolor TaxID=4558 RepID=A0A921RHC9_SORBI|nr:uncharacterized protein LOC8069795 [Sorghum bicolor]EES03526.1 hypothetical protein SORBI_3003G277000 [Sorghum bicolor]KAG0539167.1 hypothetical protein BDA96_03G299100 [Sorghum bicolor]|eukprot:XP_002458406.1 uncharacterized protein LOC8069795 [Sorghum bicolor]
MESEADRAAAPAPAPAVAAETSDDAIQEESPATAPSSDGKPGSGAAPELEVQLFRRGRPVAVFRSQLGGYTQDQLEVGDILEQHGLKSVFAFDPAARKRGVAIRFNPRNGRSLLTYAPGSTIFLDGEPKDSLLKPITKMVIGVAAMTVVAAVLLKEAKMPEWLQSSKLGTVSFPPWVLACMVIVFLRLRKRTKDVMKKFGWVS